MKVKLLKKIRKEYSVIKIAELGTNPISSVKEYAEHYGLPIFKIKHVDDENEYLENGWLFQEHKWNIFGQSKQECLDYLLKIVLNDYSEKFRHKDNKEEKVWY